MKEKLFTMIFDKVIRIFATREVIPQLNMDYKFFYDYSLLKLPCFTLFDRCSTNITMYREKHLILMLAALVEIFLPQTQN